MNKGQGWYSGSANIADTQDNLVFQDTKSRIPIANANGFTLPLKSTFNYSGNGTVFSEVASTDLHLVADDLSVGSNWASRAGGFTATRTGQPIVAVETPFYPSGGFAGTGYRNAVSTFTTSDYYLLPYNAAHQISNSSTTTYEFLVRLGTAAAEETMFGCYIPGSSKFNFRIYAKDTLGSYAVNYEVNATTRATQGITNPQNCYVAFQITIDGASKTVKLYQGGVLAATNTWTGTPVSDGVSGMYIGTGDPVTGHPSSTCQLIEIIRHQTVMDATTLLNRFSTAFGINGADSTGAPIYQTGTGRSGLATVVVNKKLWILGTKIPIINEKGVFLDASRSMGILNNAVTSGTTSLTLTASVTLANEANSFNSAAGGQTVTIPLDGSLRSAKWQESAIAGPKNSNLTVVWRPTGNAAAKAYAYIQNNSTLNYYNPSGGTWGASALAIDLTGFITSGSGTLTDPYNSNVPFTTETYAGNNVINYFVHNNSVNDGASTIKVYLVQDNTSGQSYPSPYLVQFSPNEGVSGSQSSTTLTYPLSSINYAKGRVTFSMYPVFSSSIHSNTGVNASTILGSTIHSILSVALGSSSFVMSDNAGHSITLSPTFNQYERLDFDLRWGNGAMSMAITNKALNGSSAYTSPIAGTNFNFLPGHGFINNISIYG